MRVYKFLNAQYALDAILSGNIKLSTVDELNDPYEFKGVKFTQATKKDNQDLISKSRTVSLCKLTGTCRSWHEGAIITRFFPSFATAFLAIAIEFSILLIQILRPSTKPKDKV